MRTEPLLQADNVSVEFTQHRALFRAMRLLAVDGVSLSVANGETVGLVGESGSGKSTLARALLRLVRPAAGRIAGRVRFRGQDLLTLTPDELRLQRRHMQLVFQDPLACLNPRMTIGETLQEPLKIFRPELAAPERRQLVDAMLAKVGLEARLSGGYPGQFSGGQCQRIGIARAMIIGPQLLICDEPVSALDVSIQGQIVNLLTDVRRETGSAMIFISHNLSIVRHISQRVYVIYRGRIVESADCETLFAAPRHPYTRALIDAIPQIPAAAVHRRYGRAAGLPDAPDPRSADRQPRAAGCAFADRCEYAAKACRETVPELSDAGPDHRVACLRWREI